MPRDGVLLYRVDGMEPVLVVLLDSAMLHAGR